MKSISFSITTIYRLLISLKSLQFFYTHTFLKKVKEKWKKLFKNEVILWIRFRKILPKTYPYYLLGKYAVVILDIENLICNRSSLFGICWWFFEVIALNSTFKTRNPSFEYPMDPLLMATLLDFTTPLLFYSSHFSSQWSSYSSNSSSK